MLHVYTSSVIDASADTVWARVRDFNALPQWHPNIADSRIENDEPSDRVGCIRHFHGRDGGLIREKLLALSDYDYACTYSILESPMGVDNYVATLKLTPITDGMRTFAEWSAEFDCAEGRERELTELIGQGVFQRGFDALKRHFASTPSRVLPPLPLGEGWGEGQRAPESHPLHHHRRADRPRLVDPARLQQPRPLARRRRHEPHRRQRAQRPGRLRAQLHAERRQPHSRAVARAVRHRASIHLLHRRGDRAAAALRGHRHAEAGDRRQPHVLALGVDLRDAARPRARVARDGRARCLRGRLRGLAPPPRPRRRPARPRRCARRARCRCRRARCGCTLTAAPSSSSPRRARRRRRAPAKCASASVRSASTSSTSTCAAAGCPRCCRSLPHRRACRAWRPRAR